jgi:predicted aconitase
VKLTPNEQAMLEGREGVARQKAMELLVNYAEGLGAERFVDTNNVAVLTGLFPYPDLIRQLVPSLDPDEIASKFFLDSDEVMVVDKVKAFSTSHIYRNQDYPQIQQGGEFLCKVTEKMEQYCKRIGIVNIATCTPYQSGNVPVMGEHCAWTESSAIPFCNSILGGRTNIEGLHSAFASSITGKTPLWGLHLDENRVGKVIVDVAVDMTDIKEWNLMGYYGGGQIGLDIPIYTDINTIPDITRMMALCAAGAASGSTVMFHIVGHTPEAPSADEVGKLKKDLPLLPYASDQRREAYERLNQSTRDDVDVVVLGCPHYTLERMKTVAGMLEGKAIHPNVELFVTTCRMIKSIADRNGYTEAITNAGGKVMEDTCGIFFEFDTSKVIASDSAKMVHYVPMTAGVKNTWFGTTEECIEAAITGKWKGELK